MKKPNSGKPRNAADKTDDDVLRELWAVKAALNKAAGYDPATLAAEANRVTLASARRATSGRKLLAA